MSQIVVDTDVASYIFNWHSLARHYADVLRGSELFLSFMSIAELRMGAISAGWGNRRRNLLERFMQGFELVYADNNLCTVWARIRADARAVGRALSAQDAWIQQLHWHSTPHSQRTTGGIMSTLRSFGCSPYDAVVRCGEAQRSGGCRRRNLVACKGRRPRMAPVAAV